MFQVLEVAEDLLKRSHTCKGLEEKRVDMFPKEGAKMSKDAKDFLERLKKLRGTITDLDDQINKEFEKYSGDVRYFAEYQTGLQDFYPRLVEAEDRISEGLVTPQSLVESDNTLTDTKNFQTSLEELIKVLDNAGEIAKKMSHHEHADITVASFRIRWDNAHKVSVPQKKAKKEQKVTKLVTGQGQPTSFINPQTSKVWVHCMEELFKCWNDLEQKIGGLIFVVVAHLTHVSFQPHLPIGSTQAKAVSQQR